LRGDEARPEKKDTRSQILTNIGVRKESHRRSMRSRHHPEREKVKDKKKTCKKKKKKKSELYRGGGYLLLTTECSK